MRAYLSMLMICLLALRGLLGDAMSMEALPAPMGALATTSGAHTPIQNSAHPHTDHTTVSVSVHGDGDGDGDGDNHCTTFAPAVHCAHDADSTNHCSSCMVCHSAWSIPSTTVLLPHASPATPPGNTAPMWASATVRSALKPPIV